VKAIKPQSQIYEALLKQYKLQVEESVFIDDRLDNIVAAEKLKIKAIQCQSPAQVCAELGRLGILVK
ncbi:MAG: HAD-IA family hydrolase, partial [Rhabdochlamydiaceae bacterium]